MVRVSGRRRFVTLGVGLGLVGTAAACRDVDLAPLRSDLAASAELLCRPPAVPPAGDAGPEDAPKLLATATASLREGHVGTALERCADVIGAARDQDLTGDLGAVLEANAHIQSAVATCLPAVQAAPPADAATLHRSLRALRPTFPSTLDDAIRREHAETMLETFGKARDRSQKLPCARAAALAAKDDGPPLAPFEQRAVLASWQSRRAELVKPPVADADEPADVASCRQAYTLTLASLDRLTALAEVQGR